MFEAAIARPRTGFTESPASAQLISQTNANLIPGDIAAKWIDFTHRLAADSVVTTRCRVDGAAITRPTLAAFRHRQRRPTFRTAQRPAKVSGQRNTACLPAVVTTVRHSVANHLAALFVRTARVTIRRAAITLARTARTLDPLAKRVEPSVRSAKLATFRGADPVAAITTRKTAGSNLTIEYACAKNA
jgi:hypothetical protein